MSLLRDAWIKRGPRSLDYAEFERRFWSRTEPSGDCLMWTGARQGKYGTAYVQGRNVGAHRVSFWMSSGSLVEGMEVDHICNTPLCVNPNHLQQITPKANWSRSSATSRVNSMKTHCKHGHEFTPENTRITKRGGRDCRACNRARYRRYLTENRSAINARRRAREGRALLNPPTEGDRP